MVTVPLVADEINTAVTHFEPASEQELYNCIKGEDASFRQRREDASHKFLSEVKVASLRLCAKVNLRESHLCAKMK